MVEAGGMLWREWIVGGWGEKQTRRCRLVVVGWFMVRLVDSSRMVCIVTLDRLDE